MRCVNTIVAQKAGNTTCLFGEFLSQNLPNWQVFEGFETIRSFGAPTPLTTPFAKNAQGRTVRESFVHSTRTTRSGVQPTGH